MSKQPSVFGGACIIASVCVGAGMLGLPSAGAGSWTMWTILVMLLTMIMMTLSGWMLLESYKQYDIRASFNTVTKAVLGNQVNIINNLAVYFVGGILLYAYITSSGLILQDLLGLDSKIASILFVFVFGAFVWHSTRAVDRISVLLIIFMVLSFAFSIFGLTSNISLETLFDSAKTETSEYAKYAMMMLPVALTSFGYHHSVSSMRAYYGEEKKASQAILYGTLISLFLYLVWILSIFGNLPRDQFAPIIASDGNIDVLLKTLGGVIDSPSIKQSLNAFSMAAILSSFIGVGLGVFDFLADFFKFENSKAGRTKSWLVTFLPPLILSVLFPFGFLKAIGYAGAVATVWTCIIPAILVYKVRQQNPNQQGFIACGGSLMVGALILFGILVAAFHFLTMFGMLPVFKG